MGLIDRLKHPFYSPDNVTRAAAVNPGKAPKKPMTEQQAVDYDLSQITGGGFRSDEYQNLDDKLIEKSGYAVYENMMHDSTVRMAINSKRFDVISADWKVQAATDDPRDVEIADFVQWALERMRGSIVTPTFGLLHALVTGWSIAELIWDTVPVGKYAGSWFIREIKPRNPGDTEIAYDDYGNVTQIYWKNAKGASYPVDMQKFITYTYNPVYGRFTGMSDLRAVHKNYWSKNLLIQMWNQACEDMGNPPTVGRYPAGGKSKTEQNALRTMLTRIMNRAKMAVPDDITIERLTSGSTSANALFKEAIAYHDEQIVKGIKGETLTSGEGQRVGSMALGNVHAETKEDYTTFLRADIAESVYQERVIKDLVDYNFGPQTDYPTFVWQPRKKKLVLTTAADVKTLLDTGLVTEGDLNDLRKQMGLKWTDAFDDNSTEIFTPPESAGAGQSFFSMFQPQPKPDVKAAGSDDIVDLKVVDVDYDDEIKNWTPSRELTRAEMNAGGVTYFKQSLNLRKRHEQQMIDELIPVFQRIRLDMERQINRFIKGGKITNPDAIDALAIPEKPYNEFRDVMTYHLAEIYREQYIRSLRLTKQPPESIPDESTLTIAKSISLSPLPPLEALAEIKKWALEKNWKKVREAREKMLIGNMKNKLGELKELQEKFYITNVTDNDLLREVKSAITSGMANGGGERVISNSVSQVFDKYAGVPGSVKTPARLATIVRTNTTSAYAQAEIAALSDPAVMEFNPYVQYSAILDDVTTEICAALDGRIYRSDDPELAAIIPPRHYNCRSEILPVDKEDPIIEKGPSAYPTKEQLYKGFGGVK